MGYRIDFFQQIKAFDYLCKTSLKGLTGNYRSVYFALLSFNNNTHWSEHFEIDFEAILLTSRVDKDSYRRAMDFLNDNGLFINYEKGINKWARARVSLTVLPVGIPMDNAVANTDGNTVNNGVSSAHINKTVNNKPKNNKVFIAPTLDEVVLYCKENGNSFDLAKRAFDHYNIAGWIDTHGKPVLNWKQKILTNWLNKEPINVTNSHQLSRAEITQQEREKKRIAMKTAA